MAASIDPAAGIGWVHLSVADLERSTRFYREVMGFRIIREQPAGAVLGTDGRPLVILTHQPGARPQPPGTRGLYHFAVRIPSRLELARTLQRVLRAGWSLDGAADHGVSEAIYFPDPDGHGIEIYADRPAARWPRRGGRILMATEPLDLDSLMAELREAGGDGEGTLPPATCIGHIHLHVSDLEQADGFYRGVLGMELMARYGPSALFFAAGGYHHHVGANLWAGPGAPPPPPDCVRLQSFSVALPSSQAVARLAHQVRAAGLDPAPGASAGPLRFEGFTVADPDGNPVAAVVG